MNEQPKSPNSAGMGEAAAGPAREQLAGASEADHTAAETPAHQEAAPAPGASAAPADGGQAAGGSQASGTLSPDDVAAAIAAVPGPTGPTGHVPTPTTAGDVDVIEPEWVDKAEEVVRQHQGDPYGEEEAIEDLQGDYLQKRYGFNVADPKGDSSKPETK